MQGLKTKLAYSEKAVKYETQGSYEIGKSGAWKTWHVSPHDSAKGGINKGGLYTNAYATGTYRNKIAER